MFLYRKPTFVFGWFTQCAFVSIVDGAQMLRDISLVCYPGY